LACFNITLADDLAALTAHLNLQDAVHLAHSTGGGEVVHYITDPVRAAW
jgi:pimeloyl-ACP methyl ester carboxylesterase